MLTLDAARQRILGWIAPLESETIALDRAAGRYLAGKLVAAHDLPLFDNSAMDGYAVAAADLASASENAPVQLALGGRIPAGELPDRKLARGSCVRVFTGSPVPPGADAVVMQEDTRTVPDRPGQILFLTRVRPWGNIRFRGEDIRAGAEVLLPGGRVSPALAGLLAALGQSELEVHRQPVIGLVATGSELEEAGRPLPPGKIFESNRLCLSAWLERCGALPRILPLVADEPSAIKQCLHKALTESDAVISTGGVSVGELDLVHRAFAEMGGQLDFWKVHLKPGKPFAFGRWEGKFLFGLPGNPVSAMVTFLLLVRPALLRWQGALDLDLPSHPGTLAEGFDNLGDRPHFFRVRVDPAGQVRSSGTQASHIQRSLAEANGLVELPPHTCWAAGRQVRVLRLDC